jgi:hypothetical protein
MIGDPDDVDYAALELDDEQRIELGEPDGVHDEEVGGRDAARLGDEQLLPPGPAPRCWSETVVSKYPTTNAAMELTLQHPDLVAEHHQLDVLVQSCPPAGSQQDEDPAHDEVAQAEEHGR